ncbi:EamA family transporter RarD [Rossellomorea marisflavi]|uniref:Transporter n=1 Tax=Rossellomorea marisflavi TaxID=189381 RepID=A0A0J5WE65_9BACI|nr:EamA family transporter RarD [Rossellomorea marisflavi]KMK91459.1 transporter [Rossellomorea marisflavi]KML07430.1 transporter [Rossellomorea marisflavi]KML34466.1 transporter [Rossellomorea marisflavi]KZE51875.1 transporter [Rossellomorea marisflavi]MCM2604794.1 EamA family transporter RarD [Rossellomorea marisflavi]
MKSSQTGIAYTALSYLLWGILPIYWKWLGDVPADEILANRIFWAFWFMLLFLLVTRRFKGFTAYLKTSLTKKKQVLALLVASLLISVNWFIYIWAVNTDQMVEASLGYYINPLVSILLGVFILKEKLSKAQILSFGLAAAGVLVLTLSYGDFPWIAFGLAFSFGLYGLAKKLIQVESSIGLTLETMTIAPVSIIYLLFLYQDGSLALFHTGTGTDLLLIGAGAATAIPLLFFSRGAQQIPLYMVGFLQYIAPTITLILGVWMYHEPFSTVHAIAFCFIWLALAVLTASRLQLARKRRKDARLSA